MVFAISVLMTSCYTLTYSVGEGSKTGVEVKEKKESGNIIIKMEVLPLLVTM